MKPDSLPRKPILHDLDTGGFKEVNSGVYFRRLEDRKIKVSFHLGKQSGYVIVSNDELDAL